MTPNLLRDLYHRSYNIYRAPAVRPQKLCKKMLVLPDTGPRTRTHIQPPPKTSKVPLQRSNGAPLLGVELATFSSIAYDDEYGGCGEPMQKGMTQ